jgi:transcriptional regulator with XRE-family HTH domain
MPRGDKRVRTADNKINMVGGRVKERRLELELTRDQLAARVAVASRQSWVPDEPEIYKIEDGRRSVHDIEIMLLAKALEADPCWLLVGR